MRVVICGGGIIGASTAYFLSGRGADVVVVERTGIACGASGKSGGFLARDWCDGSPLGPLARRSFDLHADLARRFEGAWGYRRLETLAVAASARREPSIAGRIPLPGWLAPSAMLHRRLGTAETTAQVHPALFTETLMKAAADQGARLHIGRVDGVVLDPDGHRVTGAIVDEQPLEAEAVVIAMGPWSALATAWLPLPMVHGLKGHSIVLRSDASVTPHALFVECESEDGSLDAPEVFPRPDGTIYICGLPSEEALPVDPGLVTTDAVATARLRGMARTFAPALGGAEVVAAQACYRPVTRDALPLIGAVPDVAGAYVATGHSVWGILNAPATGQAMADLILDGGTGVVDLEPFAPARMRPVMRRAAQA